MFQGVHGSLDGSDVWFRSQRQSNEMQRPMPPLSPLAPRKMPLGEAESSFQYLLLLVDVPQQAYSVSPAFIEFSIYSRTCPPLRMAIIPNSWLRCKKSDDIIAN
jgi:hypothetical protein